MEPNFAYFRLCSCFKLAILCRFVVSIAERMRIYGQLVC